MKMPKSWDELTVGQYQELHPTFEKEYKNPVDKVIEQLMILTNCSSDEVEALTVDDLHSLQEQMTFLNKPIDKRLRVIFKVKGNRYRFEVNARKLTGGAYMSAMHLAEKDPNTKLHQVLFNIAKPINRFGRDKKVSKDFYEDHVDDFKELPMSVAFPIVSFFLTLCQVLTTRIEDYSIQTLQKMNRNQKEAKVDLVQDMAG
jgi:hypothetical protein